MNYFRCSFALSGLLGAALSAAAMTNEDITKMTKAGLTETTIVLAIDKEPAAYDTSPGGLIELKNAGVSETVIQKMITAGKRTTEQATPDNTLSGPGYAENFPKIAPPMVDVVIGNDYFLRCTIHLEKSNYVMTNYSRGVAIAINTPVKLVAMRGDKISVKQVDTGREFTIENISKYTGKPLAGVARIMLSAEKTPLEKLPLDLANAIRSGEMRKGMNKEQVLMARGYPPAHETASVESDRWVYWSSRFIKQTIVFTNDRLVEGRMVH
jgi:hypothetical protein